MLAKLLLKSARFRRLLIKISAGRTEAIISDISAHLTPGSKVLEIGAGTCLVTAALRRKGYQVTPIDVVDSSCIDTIKPVLFDGKRFPLEDGAFETALLLNVLHHIPDPDATLREAHRVARFVIVHEDIFDSTWRKYATFVMDSVTNLQFFDHPHTNRDNAGWKSTFARLGFNIRETKYKTFWGIFQNATYWIEKK